MVFVLQIGQLITIVIIPDRKVTILFTRLDRIYAEDILIWESTVQATSEEKGEGVGPRPIYKHFLSVWWLHNLYLLFLSANLFFLIDSELYSDAAGTDSYLILII